MEYNKHQDTHVRSHPQGAAITLPDGSRVRTTSVRRFVVFGYWSDAWRAFARSDSLDTARRRAEHRDVIVDTWTGEVVR